MMARTHEAARINAGRLHIIYGCPGSYCHALCGIQPDERGKGWSRLIPRERATCAECVTLYRAGHRWPPIVLALTSASARRLPGR